MWAEQDGTGAGEEGRQQRDGDHGLDPAPPGGKHRFFLRRPLAYPRSTVVAFSNSDRGQREPAEAGQRVALGPPPWRAGNAERC